MEKSKEIIILEKKVNKAIITAEELKVTNDEEMLSAATFRKEIKMYAKSAKEEKERVTKPLNEALKVVRGWFAPIEEKCDKIIDCVGNDMQEYQNKIDTIRKKAEEEAQKKIDDAQKAFDAGKITEKEAEKIVAKVDAKLEKAPEAITKSESFHTRVDRKVKFINPKTLTPKEVKMLIDGEYLVWDEVKGRKDALAGALTIGVEIYEQKSLI